MISFIDFLSESPDPFKKLGLVKIKLLRKDGSVEKHHIDPKKSIQDFISKQKHADKIHSKSPIVDHDVEL